MLSFRTATHDDIPALIELVTSAYRGDASRQGWTTEADLLDGQRIDADMLRTDLDTPGSIVLLAIDSRDDDRPRLVACANIAAQTGSDAIPTAYFGMFSVSPDVQGGGVGRIVLAEAERMAHETLGCSRMRMTVIDAREELIAYYERRGYLRTGIKKPFPYGDPRYGLPKRDDLRFEVLEKMLEATP
ncbi:MAG: GNAT family N-acetyltransferase [Lysobacter sp.]|nr:GNAT family N-acetyltransferase [Lysobacter sp.]